MCGCGIMEPCNGCSCGCKHTIEETIFEAYKNQKYWAEFWKSSYEILNDSVSRIRDLHRPHTFMPDEVAFIDGDEPEIHCWHCVTDIQDWYPGEPYPCPTAKALNGE